MIWTPVILLGLLSGVSAERKSYSGYKILDTEALNERAVKALSPLTNVLDFWDSPRVGKPSRILVSPSEYQQVRNVLGSQHIEFDVLVSDLESSLEQEPASQYELRNGSISFTKFNRLAEIHAYLDALAEKYPQLVSVSSIGKSLEGRDLKLIKISSGGNGTRPAIFIDAAIHAREWIAPPVALYTIQQLVENYTVHKDLVDNVDWYILPVLNPDGYEYTHTTDRFWRKTRSNNGDPECLGVDANRNFDFHWGEVGSSTDLCSQSYSGPRALSESEAASLAQYLLESPAKFQLYLTLHSYGKLLLHPWRWTTDTPEDVEDLSSLGKKAADALEKVRGTKYKVGSSAGILYYSAGTSRDWAKGKAGIKYSYTMELPAGGSGFNPPPSDIIPVVTETFEAIKVFGKAIGSIKPPDVKLSDEK
ncbi:carboxypeptidase B [Anabrus simplex]|uniref:carboxypeptidase B n=1 Tax=Anabrus simplex TaxID=316456 RepID=UPI0035A3571F